MYEEPKKDQDQESVLPLSELDKAVKGLVDTPKAEVQTEADKEQAEKQARKAKEKS